MRLLRRSFARASLQNNRDMIVKIQPHGQYANSAGELIVITQTMQNLPGLKQKLHSFSTHPFNVRSM